MKRISTPLILLLAIGVLCTSCLGSDDEEYTYYDDAAITSFSLGTLNCHRYLLTADGRDSRRRDGVRHRRESVGSHRQQRGSPARVLAGAGL